MRLLILRVVRTIERFSDRLFTELAKLYFSRFDSVLYVLLFHYNLYTKKQISNWIESVFMQISVRSPNYFSSC